MPPSSTDQSDHIARRSRTTITTAIFLMVLASVSAQNGPVANEIVELLPSDGQVADQFGASVSISGDTAVIGAPFGDGSVAETGSAYIYVQGATGVWERQTKLLASDAWAYQLFGASVAISGDTALVGTPLGDGNVVGAGAVYVYVRDVSGMWAQQAKFFASDGASTDQFGFSVAISGDTAIIGASRVDDACPTDPECNSGAAYVFVRDAAGVWTQQAKLTAPDGSLHDRFGFSVDLDGNRALVGAPAGYAGLSPGSAYVFMRDAASVWSQQTKLLPADSAPGDLFGNSVSLDSDSAIVGANVNNDSGTNPNERLGSAYVFIGIANGDWAQQAKLLAPDGAVNHGFGVSVAIKADTAVIGASGDGDNGLYAGSAYVFARGASGVWTPKAKLLANNGATNDVLGISVAIRNDTAIIGSLGLSTGKAGAAYIFSLLSPADFNGDGLVNGADLTSLLVQWGMPGIADLNNDGSVDAADLAILLANWG